MEAIPVWQVAQLLPFEMHLSTWCSLGDSTDTEEAFAAQASLAICKAFNWPGKAENCSLKASHCFCLTLPCCVRTGEVQ